jgi:PKD repeat protein
MSRCAPCTPRLAMRPFRVLPVLALVAASATCHLDRLVNSSGGGGGGGPPPPGPPVTLAFTVQPRGTKPDSAIKPPIQVTARDSAGNTSTKYNGVIRVAIATDGSAGQNAKLVGDTVATAVSGVATFSGLSIDQAGTGYVLSAALATGPSMGTSAAFDVATVPPPPPTTGDLTVSAVTTGSDLDPDGYTVTVDGGQSQSLGVNASVTYSGLTAADHSVEISGVASNCTVTNANPQTASVPAGATAQVTFDITCAALPPTTGDLKVTTSTTGSNLDPDGYTVSVDGAAGQPITINNTTGITFTGLSAGSHTVALSGVAANCTVSGGNSQTATVIAGQTASVAFSVTCAALTGSLTVTTATSGSNAPSGYAVTVDGGQSKNIAASGNVSYSGLAATSHSVQLNGVPSNCSVSEANPQTVNVPANGTGQASFTVTCSAPPNQPPVAAFSSSCNGLTCSFTSTSSDPDGSITAYQWTFGDGGSATTQNPSRTYSAGGTYTVQLTVTDNQNATNSVTHSVTVTAPPPPNQPPVAAFTSSCSGLTCNFTSTSSDPDGSIAAYQWTFGDGGTATTQNPSHTYSAGGTYTVQLTVTDNQNATNSVTHSVTVTAPPPPNQPPVVTAGGNQNVLVGSLFTLSGASFSDPNHNGPWTITIDWGDGSSDVNTTSNEGSIAGSHSYVTVLPATYTVTITVTDAGGLSGSASKTVNVTTL